MRCNSDLVNPFAARLLAAIGLYAVVARAVKERVQEIGIRLALGATGPHIFAVLMKFEILPVTIGLIIGLVGSSALSRLLAFELVGVPPNDLTTLISACAVLFLSAVVACLIPARGALQNDPAIVLRGRSRLSALSAPASVAFVMRNRPTYVHAESANCRTIAQTEEC